MDICICIYIYTYIYICEYAYDVAKCMASVGRITAPPLNDSVDRGRYEHDLGLSIEEVIIQYTWVWRILQFMARCIRIMTIIHWIHMFLYQAGQRVT